MADVTLSIGDRRHTVACRDGEEAAVQRLGAMLDRHWSDAQRASGGLSAERTMMFVALMLADDLAEAQQGRDTAAPAQATTAPAGVDTSGAEDPRLGDLADRLERVAAALEQAGTNA